MMRAASTIAILKSEPVTMLQSFSEAHAFQQRSWELIINVIEEEGTSDTFKNHGCVNCKLQDPNSN